MNNIHKSFSGIVVNDGISIELRRGEIHALLGENGAGKTTLMNILFGLQQPESGEIRVQGKAVRIASPAAASRLGIGMVHQHFKLVPNYSVAENIILGREPRRWGRIDMAAAAKKIQALSATFALSVDPAAIVEELPVGMQQRVEILKMLYRQANILIFDEPTAMLSPQGTDELMRIMRKLAAEGKSIFLITHKLKEIKTVADRCTVIRRGRLIGTVKVAETSEAKMAEMMVGRQVVLKVDKQPGVPGEALLKVKDLVVLNQRKIPAVKGVSFAVHSGEILGIAGIDGNGQSELVEAIAGLRKAEAGHIELCGQDITDLPVRRRIEAGLAHVPEDRQKRGLVLEYSLAENLVLESYYQQPFSQHGILRQDAIGAHATAIMAAFDVRAGAGGATPTLELSGGNQQKAVIGREISRSPQVLLAVQPTRGLDAGATEYIHQKLLERRDTGCAILLISLELDELLNLADRIAVLCHGELIGLLAAAATDEMQIGKLMTGMEGAMQ